MATGSGKIQSIQGLRALAALMVVLFHSKLMFANDGTREQLLWVPGFTDFGDFGVSLFFVISGFIIASVIDRPSFSIGSYFWRRFLRIYPLLWIVMCAGIYHYYLRGWFAADFIAQGKYGWLLSFGSLPQQNYPFWNPGWTLEHEILFYVIAAMVAPWAGLKWLSVLLMVLGFAGLVFDFGWDFHLTADPQIYFAFGIAAYLCRAAPMGVALAVMVMGLGSTYAKLYGLVSFNPNLIHFTFSVGAAGLLVAFIQAEERGMSIPKPVTVLGDASYSIYLWHWLMVPVVGLFYGIVGGPAEVWRWIFVAASIAISLFSFYSIEKPVIKFSHKKWSPVKARTLPV